MEPKARVSSRMSKMAVVRVGIAVAVVLGSGCDGHAVSTEITIRTFPEGVPSYTGQIANASLVAFHQDNTGGGWDVLAGTDGVYRATATGSRYIVAVRCPQFGLFGEPVSSVSLYYQGVSDPADLQVPGCRRARETVPVTVELDGVPDDGVTKVWLGSTSREVLAGQPFELKVPKETVDVLATTYADAPDTYSQIPVRAYRAPEPIDPEAAHDLKLDYGVLALPFETHALSVTGFDPADGVAVLSSYATPRSLTQWTFTEPLAEVYANTPDTSYATLDPRMRRPGDVANLRVLTTHLAPDGRTFTRYVRLAMTDPVAQAIALPPALVVDPPVFDGPANRRATVTIPILPATLQTADYSVTLSTSSRTVDTPSTREWNFRVSSGYAEGQSSVTLTTAALAKLPGSDELALDEGVDVDWVIERDDRSLAYDTPPVDGRKILVSEVSGQIPRPHASGAPRSTSRDVRRQLGD